MNRNDPQLLDLLAAEFVLGTLRGRARRRFERRLESDPFAARRVRAWEDRFVTVNFRLPPVAPSPSVWPAIERRIGPAPAGRWRGLAAAVVAAAVLGLGWFIWRETLEPQARAVIAGEAGEKLWHIEVAAAGDRIEISVIGAVSHPRNRALELWALPPDAAPVSLGLMPNTGRVERALDARQRAAIGFAANLAVSDEPAGGSPTGAPTGAVLYVSPLARG
jgi:anti-sigma-K factor RskA